MLKLTLELDGESRSFPLVGAEVRIGRALDNDVVLTDASVSRHHAVVERQGAEWVVRDLESTNGVLWNDTEVEEAALAAGGRLAIGNVEFRVEEHRATAQTVVRPLSEFAARYGLEEVGRPTREVRAASGQILGFLTRLAGQLLHADAVSEVLRRVLDTAFEVLPAERGFALLFDPEDPEKRLAVARCGDRTVEGEEAELPLSETILRRVLDERVALLTYDAQADVRLAGGESIRMHGIRSAMCVPLWAGEDLLGVLQVDSPLQVDRFDERDLDLLTALANYAAVAVERVRNAQRAERERRLVQRLGRYHSPAVVETVLTAPDFSEATGARRLVETEATILFADLVGFTAFAERSSSAEVAALLETFFSFATEAVFAEGGTLDKFIGDCVMAVFGVPVAQPDHAARALRAAVAVRREVEAWSRRRVAEGGEAVAVRIALNTGPVVAGDVGSRQRVDYTVLGRAVNVAVRLEETVARPGDIVMGAETFRQAGGAVPTEALGAVELRGIRRPIEVFRVLETAAG